MEGKYSATTKISREMVVKAKVYDFHIVQLLIDIDTEIKNWCHEVLHELLINSLIGYAVGLDVVYGHLRNTYIVETCIDAVETYPSWDKCRKPV